MLAGCGGDDFKNEARAPVRLALTGVIKNDKVTVSPAKIGAGPVEILAGPLGPLLRRGQRVVQSRELRVELPVLGIVSWKGVEPRAQQVERVA